MGVSLLLFVALPVLAISTKAVIDDAPPIPLTLMQTDSHPIDDEKVKAWKATSEGLRHVFLSDCDGEVFLEKNWGERYAKAFRSLRSGGIKSDFLRLAYIAKEGGYYADADNCADEVGLAELSRRNHDLVVTASVDRPRVFNAFFGARPGHPKLAELLETALEKVEHRHAADASYTDAVMEIAGPIMMSPLLDVDEALVLTEQPRGDVHDPVLNKLVARKCGWNRGTGSDWASMAQKHQTYWPEGEAPSACLTGHRAEPHLRVRHSER